MPTGQRLCFSHKRSRDARRAAELAKPACSYCQTERTTQVDDQGNSMCPSCKSIKEKRKFLRDHRRAELASFLALPDEEKWRYLFDAVYKYPEDC